MVSETDRMKHAEHWQSSSTPTLNQTELKAAFWLTSRVSSAWRCSAPLLQSSRPRPSG